MWIASICSQFIAEDQIGTTIPTILTLASLTASMIVNPLVTGLIVFRIFNVFRKVKDTTTSNEKSLGVTGGKTLRSIIFIIIESGMALFAIQLAQLVTRATGMRATGLREDAEVDIYRLIIGILEMLNVIISSVIVTLYSTDNMAARV